MIGAPNAMSVAPWANTELLIAVVVALGGIGASAGFWEWLKSRKKKKISAEEHEKAVKAAAAADTPDIVDAAMTIVGKWESMVASIEKRHAAELEKVNTRLSNEVARNNRLERRVDNLSKESRRQSRTIYYLRAAVSRIQEWWERIEADWEEVRQQPHPPKFPHIEISEEA